MGKTVGNLYLYQPSSKYHLFMKNTNFTDFLTQIQTQKFQKVCYTDPLGNPSLSARNVKNGLFKHFDIYL